MIQTILSLMGGLDSGPGVDVSDTSGLGSGMDLGHMSFDGNFDAGMLDAGFDGNLDHGGPDMMPDMSDLGDLNGSTDGGNPVDMSIFRLFTFQSMVAFLTVFSWSSIVSIQTGTPETISILIGLLLGFVAMFAVAKLIQLSARLTENGTMNLRNAIGENGSVYIPIPPAGKGEGKITLNLQGRYVECSAVTNQDVSLSTGSSVRVIDLRNGVLVVEADK